jgi:hypothetical protein
VIYVIFIALISCVYNMRTSIRKMHFAVNNIESKA